MARKAYLFGIEDRPAWIMTDPDSNGDVLVMVPKTCPEDDGIRVMSAKCLSDKPEGHSVTVVTWV